MKTDCPLQPFPEPAVRAPHKFSGALRGSGDKEVSAPLQIAQSPQPPRSCTVGSAGNGSPGPEPQAEQPGHTTRACLVTPHVVYEAQMAAAAVLAWPSLLTGSFPLARVAVSSASIPVAPLPWRKKDPVQLCPSCELGLLQVPRVHSFRRRALFRPWLQRKRTQFPVAARQQQADLPGLGAPAPSPAPHPPEHYGYASSNVSPALPLPTAHSTLPAPCHNLQTSTPGIVPPADHPSGYGAALDGGPTGYFLSSGHARPDGAPALESPRIEITSCLGLYHNNNQFFHDVEVEDVLPSSKRSPSTATLSLPSLEAYRDPSCLSPASSLSSRSCNSEASSYESNYSYPYASPQTSPWQSPCVSPKTTDPEEGFPRGLGACTLLGSPRHSPSTSPRASVTEESWLGARSSRPASPCNKRKYSLNGRQPPYSPHHSPTPSPHGSPRVSVTDDSWLGNTTQYTSSAIVAAINALTTDSSLDLGDGVPVKSRKTTLEQPPSVALKVEPVGEDLGSPPPPADFAPEDFSSFQHIRKGGFCDQYLAVPQHPYQWAKPKPLSPASYMSPTLPALDWQLPSHSGPYELRIEVQPKSHHRAHYETEGSRGAVKASAGGHPIVQLHGYLESEPLMLQLFIGTADDRLLRPHAFYQVHRITGKTVSTTSHEAILSNTKVLEIPLLPENSMRAVIDCAGILKLRNSDIELRKGETDIGRKNTRVRLVFRVHVPQPSGRTLSLQVASNPIECSQRSAQELPLVEKQSTDSYPVMGGKKMVLSGHNFLQDSKVIFVEKAPDGHHVWEMEAKTDRDLCKPNSLVVEIPPFRNQRITSPVHVSFYVCNGKRKRSQYQRFTYLPANVNEIIRNDLSSTSTHS
ncbi:PREDICTED: nuclear factor of activated T-cells, cytoplasmic 1 [Mandrillus leucophaeus]|nr:PREDICTED: nuclear factor of activated T-cells, cytoplasmic 1 [Mandrillus leucophaeus]